MTALAKSLAKHEATIERGLGTFVEVGQALLAIREDRLYRDGYETFEAYCGQRWGFTSSRARQLVGAAETVTAVTSAGGSPPTTEREARALNPLKNDPDKMASALDTAAGRARAEGRPMNAGDVKAAVAETLGKPSPARSAAPTPPAPDSAPREPASEFEENFSAAMGRIELLRRQLSRGPIRELQGLTRLHRQGLGRRLQEAEQTLRQLRETIESEDA